MQVVGSDAKTVAAASEVLAKAKIRSMNFIKQMFQDRGYKTEAQRLVFDQQQNLWKIFTETVTGARVMAVFSDCKAFGDSLQIDEVEHDTAGQDKSKRTDFHASKSSTSQNTGMDFIKHIVAFATAQDIQIVILVTDFMTAQALKYINSISNGKRLRITHFNYDETGVEHMASHIAQPVVFRALKGDERTQFVTSHPMYRTELPKYAVNDALVKYYGMRIGDVIYIEDNDRQTALVKEYGYVVEDI